MQKHNSSSNNNNNNNNNNSWKKKKKGNSSIAVGVPKTKAIYIKGLPVDVTEEEVADALKMFGILQVDVNSGKPRIKLYRNSDGALNGDGVLWFVRHESVENAIRVLDGTRFRPADVKSELMTVEEASFEKSALPADSNANGNVNNNTYNNNNNNVTADDEKLKEKKKALAAAQAKKTSWEDEDNDDDDFNGRDADADGDDDDNAGITGRSAAFRAHPTVVVLKNMFTPDEIDDETDVKDELTEDICGECTKFGPVLKFTLYDRHPEGVCVVRFGDHISAKAAISGLNGRYFGGSAISAYFDDGKVNFAKQELPKKKKSKIKESEEDEERRLKEFGDWLENQ